MAFVAIVGDDERANGSVSIKDLRSGAQETVPRAAAAAYIAARVTQNPELRTQNPEPRT